MRKLAKLALTLALGITFASTAIAGGAQYGTPPALTASAGNVKDTVVGYVYFINYTNDTFTTFATMTPSNIPYSAVLGSRNTPQHELYYTLTYPSETCADIAVKSNSSGQYLPIPPAYSHLCSSYTITIGNPGANGLPTVTVTPR